MGNLQATEPRQCELCNQTSLEQFSVANSCTLWFCSPCGFYQQGQPADDSSYAAAYHQGYVRRRGKKVLTAVCRLNRVAPLVDVQQPRLLDVGCSAGCTVEAANRRGWSGVGVDVSDDMVHYCRQLGLNCHKSGTLRLPFADQSFDIVTAWHVIEHVADVSETLAEWLRVLKPGGVLAIETPDADCPKARRRGREYRKFWPPEHSYTFTAGTLNEFLRRAGFESLRRPVFGSLWNIPRQTAAYVFAYRSYQGLRAAAGLSKEFQLFARRPREVSNTGSREAAA